MKHRPRIYYTESQKALMWDRWQKGESLQQIAQLFDRTDLSAYSQAKLNAVARKLNDRPRKTLNHETPAERFSQSVASTGWIRTDKPTFLAGSTEKARSSPQRMFKYFAYSRP